MAYFPNGTAGEYFESRECRDCIHQDGQDGESGCMVWMLHFIHNYDQNKDDTLKEVLTVLIDDTKPLGDMCSMRIKGKW